MAERVIRIGMIGAGVVGQGILRLLETNAASIHARLGTSLEVRKVAVRDIKKTRFAKMPLSALTADPMEVIRDPNIDVVVEVMGGVEPAFQYVRAAIEQGHSVVTANKALLAEHGNELIELAEKRGVDLYFEAAVAGGVPVIRVLREALASDQVIALRGIVNGTSNYILSQMSMHGLDFKDALKQAQDAGYAEADPTLDVSGGDASHKLTLLTMLAFGVRVRTEQIQVHGIDQVGKADIEFARKFGYAIKPLALARYNATQELELRVGPMLISKDSPLAHVHGALNAVYIEGKTLGPCLLSGQGAGALPTATSVVSDIIDVGRNLLSGAKGRVPVRSFQGSHLSEIKLAGLDKCRSRFYLRLIVSDEPGVLASVASVLGQHGISIAHMVQEGKNHSETQEPVTMVMVTHHAVHADMARAAQALGQLKAVHQGTVVMPIEDAE